MENNLRIITDFDGPIIDTSERYYHVYKICLEKAQHPNQKLLPLKKEEFWNLKRASTPEGKIGSLSGLNSQQCEKFTKIRHELVHQLKYLVKDCLVEGAIATLEELKNAPNIDLVVMTMRKKKELDLALKQYNLEHFFPSDRRYYIDNNYIKTSDIKDKPLLMTRAVKELPPIEETWMIGDKEADIVAAQNHNIKVISVLSGIRNKAKLEAYKPNFIASNLTEAIAIIKKEIY